MYRKSTSAASESLSPPQQGVTYETAALVPGAQIQDWSSAFSCILIVVAANCPLRCHAEGHPVQGVGSLHLIVANS